MSDLNASHTSKNNLTDRQYVAFSTVIDNTEVLEKGTSLKNDSIRSTDAGTSYSRYHIQNNYEPISLGIDICAPSISEEVLCDNFLHSDGSFLDSESGLSSSGQVSSKSNIAYEDNAVFINKTKKDFKSRFSQEASKYSLDSENISTKIKSNSNFSIFGQLLNKRQSSNSGFRSSGNCSNYSSPSNSRQNSPSHDFEDVSSTSEPSDRLQRAQMKTKLKSMWNNMKYGWRMKREVNLKTDSAVWLLGQCYHNKLNDCTSPIQDVAEQLKQDVLSKIWLTYRINFPTIPGTNLVTDSGWGCMLRSGQMMMAQGFVCHFLQRDWRLSYEQTDAKSQVYKMILRWFGDSLSDKSPFSLHHLVSLGENYGRKAGDWYGPTHAAHVLRDALLEAKKNNPHLEDLCMYVASDGIVFKQDVIDLFMDSTGQEEISSLSSLGSDFANISLAEVQNNSCNDLLKDKVPYFNPVSEEEVNEEPKSFMNPCPSYSEYGPPSYSTVKLKSKSLILFVSVRLGNDKINPFYIPCLKSLLAYENCIGIIGGRPKHALYFVGWQDDKIIHMDPHSCQPAIDVEKEDFNEKSFHSSSIRTMSFTEMDPSCAIGFYFRELEDFQIFVEKFSEITAPLKRNLEYPVFALADGKRVEVEDDMAHPNDKLIYTHLSSSSHDDDDDYILL